MSSRRSGIILNWLELQGTHGEFQAPGSDSPVTYLLTHASLGAEGTGNTQLTKYLVPMRELFDVGDLNFDELLQRDLDDHRVASEIIPYLLKQSPSARFFPPILAVILPVQGRKALDTYPQCNYISEPEKGVDGKETGYTKEISSFGKVMEVERYKDKNGFYANETKLRINPDQAKIVVLDGQHRAMAILAIRRSQTGEWGDRAADYKHFYEDTATELKNKSILNEMERVELPICLAFLPENCEKGKASSTSLTIAFRKLFLDVNKEARRPTRSRQLLLDDSNIISVLSRSILSSIRNIGQQGGTGSYAINLDSFEYDSPTESPKPQRDLAICTIEMLYEIVRWSVFADNEYYVNQLKVPPTSGRFSINLTRFFAEVRAEEKITSAEIKEWGFEVLENELVPTDLPSVCHDRFSELFMDMWGNCIIQLLSSLHPMQCHVEAVAELRSAHRSETGHGKLAWRALFDGQGIYWTIKNYTEHRRAEAISRGKALPITDVEKAYEAITQSWIPDEFEKLRAKKYFNFEAVDNDSIKIVNRTFQIYRTMAFQIGFVMAVASLKKNLNIADSDALRGAVNGWIAAWNHAFTFHPKSERGARSLSIFDPRGKGLMARHFGKLQKGDWIWFRYFSFEMLDAVSIEKDFLGKEFINTSVSLMRKKYIHKLSENLRSYEKRQGKDVSVADSLKRATEVWFEALNYSLGIKKKTLQDWWKEEKNKPDTQKYDGLDENNGIIEDDELTQDQI